MKIFNMCLIIKVIKQGGKKILEGLQKSFKIEILLMVHDLHDSRNYLNMLIVRIMNHRLDFNC